MVTRKTVEKNLIEVWYGELDEADSAYRDSWVLLGPDERGRAEKITNTKHRNQYVNAQGTIRNLLSQYTKTEPQEIVFGKGEYGKPYLVSNRNIDFNLSHSGSKMAFAIGRRCPLGVDIEIWKHRTHLAGLVKKCFSDEERIYWESLPEEMKLPAFHDFWTKKESFVKAVGRGIAMGMSRCVISPDDAMHFLAIPDIYGYPEDWKVIELDLGEGISGALTVPNRPCEIKIRNFRPGLML